jgi:hypothetical protein
VPAVKVQALLDLLSEYSPEAEVRIVRDHRYPIEHELDGVVSLNEIESFEHDADLADDQPEVVFLLVGQKLGVARHATWDAWEASR